MQIKHHTITKTPLVLLGILLLGLILLYIKPQLTGFTIFEGKEMKRELMQ